MLQKLNPAKIKYNYQYFEIKEQNLHLQKKTKLVLQYWSYSWCYMHTHNKCIPAKVIQRESFTCPCSRLGHKDHGYWPVKLRNRAPD